MQLILDWLFWQFGAINWRFLPPFEEDVESLKRNILIDPENAILYRRMIKDIEHRRRRKNPLCDVADLINECKK